ncbi:TniQ family protein [Paraburkholderia caledonica]|uniref:TniQ family protein n=1 Tax=Paraburkholderia caledonica TaxID=134536 RepID=UPI0033953F18
MLGETTLGKLRGTVTRFRNIKIPDTGGLNQQYWNGRRPRYCPSCLAATPYWRALWDITLVTACPIHCVELCDSCSRCNHPLSWKRARLTEIALRALQATLKAINAGGRAGIVMQTVGSGLSLSLMAYLALCKSTPPSVLSGLS